MTRKARNGAATRSKALGRDLVFSRPQILAGEDAEAYNRLVAEASNVLQPSDVIEEILVARLRELYLGGYSLAESKKRFDREENFDRP